MSGAVFYFVKIFQKIFGRRNGVYRIFQKLGVNILQKFWYYIWREYFPKFGGRKFYSFHLKSLPINVKVKGVFQNIKKRNKKGCMLLGTTHNVGENCNDNIGNGNGNDIGNGRRDSKGLER